MTKRELKSSTSVIKGVILKCIDGRWADADGLTPAGNLTLSA
jgi:hypothetical protein